MFKKIMCILLLIFMSSVIYADQIKISNEKSYFYGDVVGGGITLKRQDKK